MDFCSRGLCLIVHDSDDGARIFVGGEGFRLDRSGENENDVAELIFEVSHGDLDGGVDFGVVGFESPPSPPFSSSSLSHSGLSFFESGIIFFNIFFFFF